MKDVSGARESCLEAALSYAARGWHVFPLRAGSKGAHDTGGSGHYLPKGHLDATTDAEAITAWWTQWPDANIGLHLAASGLVAIDADTYKSDCGWDEVIAGRDLPETLIQRSASGGTHYIFKASPSASFAGKLAAGVDIKHKVYILVEPSTFGGMPYRFANDAAPVPVPDWVPTKGDCGPSSATGLSPLSIVPRAAIWENAGRASSAEVEELLAWIDPDIGGYDAWIEVLQGLHDHFDGDAEGLGLADDWSRQGAKYVPGEVASKWRGFHQGGGVTIRSVAMRARDAGADLPEISRKHRAGRDGPQTARPRPDGIPDLSHDQLALDLGERSWNRNARHVDVWGKWLFWTGTHWQRDETLNHLTRVRLFLRQRAGEVLTWAEERASAPVEVASGDRVSPEKWARNQARAIRSSATVSAVAGLARANPASATLHDAFDADRFLLGTPGGTVDLRSGVLRPAMRDDMISRQTACAPADIGARPERWCRFLDEIFEGDVDTIAFMQRAAGYALTGSVDEHKLLFLHGSGRNGKSVFLNTLLDIWGDYGRRVAATTFLYSQTERHPTDIAGLQGARLAIASELPRGKTWDEATIKDLTGGDRLTARYMRQDYFDFDPQLTLMIAGNTQPSFRGVDEAIRSRVVLVPFATTIPEEKRDRALPARLKAEAPAILRWCIEGALDWRKRGLDVPAGIRAVSETYFDEEDTLGQFLGDETSDDPHAFTSSDDLIQRFNFWCDRQGLQGWTKRTLVKELKLRGYGDAKSNGRRGLRGLRLR